MPPPRRRYARRVRRKDGDLGEQALRVQALTWAVVLGIVAGGGWGLGLGLLFGWNGLVPSLVGVVVVFAVVYGIALGSARGGARVVSTIHTPSGASTPHHAEYSAAQALAARGRYGEAAAAYEAAVLAVPADPEPYVRLARLCRDHLDRPEDGAGWFRRARRDAVLTPGQELALTQELIELYTHRLRAPHRAIPELARLCERFPGTPAGEAAARELAALRATLGDGAAADDS